MRARILIAWLVGVTAYMFAMIISVYDGILSLLFQPIFGGVISGVTVLFSLASASLMRRVIGFKNGSWLVALLAMMVGFGLIWLSNSDRFAHDEYDRFAHQSYRVLYLGLAIPGLFLTILGPLLSPVGQNENSTRSVH